MAALHDGCGLRRARALLPPAWRTAPPPAMARIGVAQAQVVRIQCSAERESSAGGGLLGPGAPSAMTVGKGMDRRGRARSLSQDAVNNDVAASSAALGLA